jgi:hypothetical protein
LTPEGATELRDIYTNSVTVPVPKGGDYEILKVSDANCRGISKKMIKNDKKVT